MAVIVTPGRDASARSDRVTAVPRHPTMAIAGSGARASAESDDVELDRRADRAEEERPTVKKSQRRGRGGLEPIQPFQALESKLFVSNDTDPRRIRIAYFRRVSDGALI